MQVLAIIYQKFQKKIPGSYEGTISNKTSNIVFSNDKTETLNKAIKQSPKLNLPVTKEVGRSFNFSIF